VICLALVIFCGKKIASQNMRKTATREPKRSEFGQQIFVLFKSTGQTP
jgi:hypothetical protein